MSQEVASCELDQKSHSDANESPVAQEGVAEGASVMTGPGTSIAPHALSTISEECASTGHKASLCEVSSPSTTFTPCTPRLTKRWAGP